MPDLKYKLEFKQPRGNSFGAQLDEIITFLGFLKDNSDPGSIILSLKNLEFVHPLFILPLAALYNDLINRGIKLSVELPIQIKCYSYLKRIKFPEGIQPDKLSDWEKALNKFSGKNYFPIINFTTELTTEHTKIRERLLSGLHVLSKKI